MIKCTIEDLKEFDTWKAWKNGEVEVDLTAKGPERTVHTTDNLTIFTNEYNQLKGQFVISHDEVRRFIGLVDDEEDYYYATYNGRVIELHTCLSSLTPLKGYIFQKDYDELIRIAKLNHYDQSTSWGASTKDFCDQHKLNLTSKWDDKTKFILGPCWDLN